MVAVTPEQLDAIRARADNATPGPWEVDADGGVSTESVPEGGQWSRPWSSPVPVVDTEGCGMGNPADAEFIAHARADVPALLAEIDRLAAELAESEREHEKTLAIMEAALDDRDRAREECGHERHMRKFASDELGRSIAVKMRAEADRDRLAATVDRVRELVDEANEWRPVESRDEGECFPAVIVDDLIAGLRAAIEGTDS